ncbi:MAG: type II toxin-antitoxin system HigB family toxin [Chloroflexi bacterium]|nr:type II toxin-antitoxin system HigB family toxin [Chloroflexota bacterium]
MRIIAKGTLRDYWESHPTAEDPLNSWYSIVKGEDWDSPAKVKAMFPKASIVGDNRVVFNIKGNDYRLIVQINYPRRIVYIRFIGTHAEYDRIDAREV